MHPFADAIRQTRSIGKLITPVTTPLSPVMTGLCDKLVDTDPELNIVPRLATGYEWADSKTLIFHLRPNVSLRVWVRGRPGMSSPNC